MNIFTSIANFFRGFRPQPEAKAPPVVVETQPAYVPTPEVVTPFAPPIDNGDRAFLYGVAITFLGKDASPNDMAPDEYGCADTVCSILEAAYPNDVGFPHLVSTTQLYLSLQGSDKYFKVDAPLQGDIVISPTGYGNGSLANGHVGIKGINDEILSNSSATGNFISNYTMEAWRLRYVVKGGFPMEFFRRK